MVMLIINFVGGVVKDQAEADEDLSIKQRTALAVGKGLIIK